MNANDNIGMKMSELVMWISEFQLYTWVMLNSLMFRITDYVGSQWAILMRTVVPELPQPIHLVEPYT